MIVSARSASAVATVAIAAVGLVALGKYAYKLYRTRSRVERVYKLIDEINSQDPRDPPQELEYGVRMTKMLERYDPKASDVVKIACRGQHVARWRIKRTEFPEGKAGYLRWRKSLYAMHASLVAELLRRTGDFTEEEIARTSNLIGKQWDLKTDSEANAVEDCAALVFLNHYFPAFTDKLNEAEKMIDIVRKTWGKMSEKGRAEALKLSLPPAQLEIVKRALSAGAPPRSAEED